MDEEQKYIESLSQKELKSYNIAKEHLGSSFEIRKSIGFIKWLLAQLERNCESQEASL